MTSSSAVTMSPGFGSAHPPTPGSLDHMLAIVRAQLGMEIAFVSHVASGKVTIRNAIGNIALVKTGDVFDEREGYCKRIIEGRIPYVISDSAGIPEVARLACTRKLPVVSHISVPIKLSDGSIYGTFCCFSSSPKYSLSDRDVQMMHVFAALAAAQIEVELRHSEESDQRIARISDIIHKDCLTIVYQPIFRLSDSSIVGVECLARFPDGALRPPSEWFAEAAEVGLGVELELTAMRAALRGLPYIPAHTYLAINASPAAILSGKIGKILRDVPTGRVVLEITEHDIVADYVLLGRELDRLRKLVRIAIDDAGAGYAGFRHILEIRPDIIKLDMSLTRSIDTDRSRSALATALLVFAREINATVIAEGVETKAESDALLRLSVDCGQGYFFSKPMPIAAASRVLFAARFNEI